MRSILQDLRFGARLLAGSPGFTIVAVVTLALGIAATTTVFSWIDAILLSPLPGVADGKRIAVLETFMPTGEFVQNSYRDYLDYRDSLECFSGLAAWRQEPVRLGQGFRDRPVWAQFVSGNFFEVLGVKPFLGRFFLPEDNVDRPGGVRLAVLNHRAWRTTFAADPAIVGKTVRINRQDFTILGVAPPEFHGSMKALSYELWLPLPTAPRLLGWPASWLEHRGSRMLNLIGRLRPGETVEQARAMAAARARRLSEAYDLDRGLTATVVSLPDSLDGAEEVLRAPLKILMGICVVVFLIACANVANLLLARATTRRREFGVRLALGAGRFRLARQLLTESLLLAAMAAGLAVLLSSWIGEAIAWLLPSAEVNLYSSPTANRDYFLGSLAAAIVAVLVSGIAPVLSAIGPDLNEILKEGGRGERSGGARSNRARGLLVVSEVALAAVALIGAGLFVRSFAAARAIQPGFDPANVLISRVYRTPIGDAPDQDSDQFWIRLRRRLEAAPGIAGVTYADTAPLGLGPGPWVNIFVKGYTDPQHEEPMVYRSVVAPGFFSVLRMPLLSGREFTERDEAKAEPVVIVNQTFAQRFFDGADPVGRKVRVNGTERIVVGMVRNGKYFNPAEAPLPFLYLPFAQAHPANPYVPVYIRTAGDPTSAVAALEREVRAADPDAAVYGTALLSDYITGSLFQQKVAAVFLAALGILSVVLAGVGQYSVMAYAVSRRRHEIGIRVALGAQRRDIVRMVLKQALGLTAAGLAIGIACALAAARLVSGMLVKVDARDPLTFAGAALFLAGLSALAGYLPARRATKADPAHTLRD